MRALLLAPDGPALRDHPFEARPGEAVVRVRLAGVCATDLELVKGYMGFRGVLGHEWVGEVESAPDPAWLGRRVVGEINCPCGDCQTCAAGRERHCPSRTVLGILNRDGAFAERLSLPLANLHPVPDAVPDESAAFVEPLAAALRILSQVHIDPAQRVLVLGLGRLGQLVARVLALTGAEVVGATRSETRRALLPPGVVGVAPEALRGLFDVAVDCTGQSAGLALARSCLRAGGTLVLKSTVHDLGGSDPTGWVVDEITVVGSRCGPFAPALRLLASGAVDPRPLITARRGLSAGTELLDLASAPEAIKVLVDPQG